MKKIFYLTIIFLLFALKIFCEIKSVTVFSDRALVTRAQQKDSKSGINEMVFKSIPLSVDAESLRTKGFVGKTGGLKILDIRVIKNYETSFSETEEKKLKDKIEKTKETINILKVRLEGIKQQKKYLDIFSLQAQESNNANLERGKFSTRQWEEAFGFYASQSQKLDDSWFKTKREIKEIRKKLKNLDDQYLRYKDKYSYYSLDAYVSYQLRKDSNVEILLSYIVPDTYWYPIYDCRLDLNSKNLIIEYFAKVYQKTGEDWNNVNLSLSTARPDLSGQIPELDSWVLDFYYYYEKKAKKMDKKGAYKMALKEEAMAYDEDYAGSEVEEEKEVEKLYQADVDSQGVALSYVILQKTSIPSGKEEIRVTISSKIDLKPKLSWAIVPRLNESSFLKGKIKNESKFTFLPGKINIFVNDSFIGKSGIKMINPGQEFDLSLGRDPRVSAEFKLDNVEKGKKVTKKYEKRLYTITISNNSDEDITIDVKDIIPKSIQPKKIIIKIIRIEPEPKEIKSDSIYTWQINIKKNEKAKIIEEWMVEYPEHQNVSGL